MSKKRRDPVALFSEACELAAAVVRDTEDERQRADRLAAGLVTLWPAPLVACFLSGSQGPVLTVRDESGHLRPEWHEAVRSLFDASPEGPMPAPPSLPLPDHVLHYRAIRWDQQQYGALALALHRRATEAPLAQALLGQLAEHLGCRLAQQEVERRGQVQYRDLADLTNLVGHEFNNELNAIGLQVAALAQKGLTAEHFGELGEIRRQVASAGLLVRQLQGLCYQANPPRQSADLNRAVHAAVGQRARLELAPDLPFVQGTPLDLERLADALIRGCCPRRAAHEVTVRTGRDARPLVWLRVEDAAGDPDNELLPRLFEPFVSLWPEDDGTALALARAVARRLGGSARVERLLGGGLVFIAELRAAD